MSTSNSGDSTITSVRTVKSLPAASLFPCTLTLYMSPENVLISLIVKSNKESKCISDWDTDVLVELNEAVNAVLEKSSNVTSVISVPTGLLPVGNVIVGGSSGTIVVSFTTSNIFVLNLGTVTVSSINLLVTASNFVIVTCLSGISTSPPCISAVNKGVLDFITNLGSSLEA